MNLENRLKEVTKERDDLIEEKEELENRVAGLEDQVESLEADLRYANDRD